MTDNSLPSPGHSGHSQDCGVDHSRACHLWFSLKSLLAVTAAIVEELGINPSDTIAGLTQADGGYHSLPLATVLTSCVAELEIARLPKTP